MIRGFTEAMQELQDRGALDREQHELPPVGKHVMVICRSFRCLGYRDQDGTWRGVPRSEILPEVIRWLDFESSEW